MGRPFLAQLVIDIAKNLGAHVCVSCGTWSFRSWERLRERGWWHGTWGAPPYDGITLCDDCHQNSEGADVPLG
jgi:hypothetical protein